MEAIPSIQIFDVLLPPGQVHLKETPSRKLWFHLECLKRRIYDVTLVFEPQDHVLLFMFLFLLLVLPACR